MPKTQQEKMIAALQASGNAIVRRTGKTVTLTRNAKPGTFYFAGSHGSLRVGKSKTNSIPASDAFKAKLIEDYDAAHRPKQKLDNVELDL